jgi:hypothetical protein
MENKHPEHYLIKKKFGKIIFKAVSKNVKIREILMKEKKHPENFWAA